MLHPTLSLNERWCKSFNSKKKLVQLSMNNTGLALLFEKCCNIFFSLNNYEVRWLENSNQQVQMSFDSLKVTTFIYLSQDI
jgi:hypothetical protein